jgi:hypothetical protein
MAGSPMGTASLPEVPAPAVVDVTAAIPDPNTTVSSKCKTVDTCLCFRFLGALFSPESFYRFNVRAVTVRRLGYEPSSTRLISAHFLYSLYLIFNLQRTLEASNNSIFVLSGY